MKVYRIALNASAEEVETLKKALEQYAGTTAQELLDLIKYQEAKQNENP